VVLVFGSADEGEIREMAESLVTTPVDVPADESVPPSA
jgi:hypothetical protein